MLFLFAGIRYEKLLLVWAPEGFWLNWWASAWCNSCRIRTRTIELTSDSISLRSLPTGTAGLMARNRRVNVTATRSLVVMAVRKVVLIYCYLTFSMLQ